MPLQVGFVPEVIMNVIFHLSKKDWNSHPSLRWSKIGSLRVLWERSRNLALYETGFMTSQSSRLRFSFLFWIDIESTLQCTVHGYVHILQFVIRVYPHMDVMFNVEQWQTQGDFAL